MLATLSKIRKMMDTKWKSPLAEVSKPLTHLYRLIRRIGAKVKGAKVGPMVTISVRVVMSEMETTTATTTSTGVTIV